MAVAVAVHVACGFWHVAWAAVLRIRPGLQRISAFPAVLRSELSLQGPRINPQRLKLGLGA